GPCGAPTRRFSSPSNRNASANAPRSRGSAAATASAGVLPFLSSLVTRWAMTSVSVSLEKTAPSAVRADADGAAEGLAVEPPLQVLELALGPPSGQMAAFEGGDPGRVIAAV